MDRGSVHHAVWPGPAAVVIPVWWDLSSSVREDDVRGGIITARMTHYVYVCGRRCGFYGWWTGEISPAVHFVLPWTVQTRIISWTCLRCCRSLLCDHVAWLWTRFSSCSPPLCYLAAWRHQGGVPAWWMTPTSGSCPIQVCSLYTIIGSSMMNYQRETLTLDIVENGKPVIVVVSDKVHF